MHAAGFSDQDIDRLADDFIAEDRGEATGAVLGAVAGHAAAGMSRHDLKELGEHLDVGQAGLVVVGISDMGAKIEQAMRRAEQVQAKQLKADNAAIEADAKDAGGDQAPTDSTDS